MLPRYYLRFVAATVFVALTQGCVEATTAPDARVLPTPQAGRSTLALEPVDLGTLGGLSVGRSSEAHAINPAGDIVGWGTPTGTFGAFGVHAILWRDGQLIDLGTLGGTLSRARGISPSGVIVGARRSPATSSSTRSGGRTA